MELQDLEQEIMKCWNVVEDIDTIYKYIGDDPFFQTMEANHVDKLMNLMLGLKELYNVKFDHLFSTYEHIIAEGTQRRSSGD